MKDIVIDIQNKQKMLIILFILLINVVNVNKVILLLKLDKKLLELVLEILKVFYFLM